MDRRTETEAEARAILATGDEFGQRGLASRLAAENVPINDARELITRAALEAAVDECRRTGRWPKAVAPQSEPATIAPKPVGEATIEEGRRMRDELYAALGRDGDLYRRMVSHSFYADR